MILIIFSSLIILGLFLNASDSSQIACFMFLFTQTTNTDILLNKRRRNLLKQPKILYIYDDKKK